jgi:hypothetical protein
MARRNQFSVGELTVDTIIGGGLGIISPGIKVYLDPVNGSDANDGFSEKKPVKTLAVAYAMLTTNKNDVLYIIGGASALALSSTFTWDKSYTHMIGITAETLSGGRVRITQSDVTSTVGEFIISGVGCRFVNIHWQCGTADTNTSLIGVSITGERNLFENCYFEGFLGATVGAAANCKLVNIDAAVQDLSFIHCLFGNHTIMQTSSTASVIYFKGPNNSNIVFENCVFQNYMSNTGACTLRYAASAMPTSGWTLLKRCSFMNLVSVNYTDMILMTSAASGIVTLEMPSFSGYGTKVYCTSAHKTNIFVCNAAGAATGGVGANPA